MSRPLLSSGGATSCWRTTSTPPPTGGPSALPRAVSPDGNTIVGYDIRNGNTEAFVAVVPEPSRLSLPILGSLALLRRRIRGT